MVSQRGSCFEIIPILEIACQQKLLTDKEKEKLYNDVVSLAKMLSKLKSSL
ncbi:hypothetical protein HZB97_03710 [Candidatus Gottesmanbacteria bacterium]|nr:hypothetical protein [Candidatus Gottesmanbacteria bacterium]MBI5465232.1 hypothetical protein [Candidatus Gottesmanbacteria bacterium]